MDARETKPLDLDQKQILTKIANTIRGLSIDGVQKANSGHPGLPLGCAEIGAYLYGILLKQNPKDPYWLNRDRFILSAGHGSMFLYSCLHLAGYDLPLEELKNFRQLNSRTPGHPESHETIGVEATTGPLGQGVGNAVGHALGLKLLGEKFNTPEQKIFDAKVYCIAGDGCIMEGVSSEVSSLAGHLQLNNLILIYDANKVCLDGPLAECCSENTAMRYKAYGWDVTEIDGNDLDQIHATFSKIQESQTRPCLVIAKTIIGKGSPNKAGTNKVHGSPLGEEEVKATKQALGLPLEDFYIPQQVKSFFEKKLEQDKSREQKWQSLLSSWKRNNPEKAAEFKMMEEKTIPADLEERLKEVKIASPVAGRKASQDVINALADWLPYLYGGSADLSVSDLTMIKKYPLIAPGSFHGRNIKYGVREFGMATIANGLAQGGMILPFIGTFLTFSDYMRNGIRLAALSRLQVIYQFTHESIFLGEDGPTHQPIEHYASLRAIPNLHLFRPADVNEIKGAWVCALHYQGPTAILLSRQNLPEVKGTEIPYNQGVGRGGYILRKEKKSPPDFTFFATGSEVSLAVSVADELEKRDKSVRVISMPCWSLFEEQSSDYKVSVFGGNLGKRVSIEAGVELGWHKYIGSDGIAIAMEGYGASAPAGELAGAFGFTVESVLERIL